MLKKAINALKNYKLINLNFRLIIYVFAVTAIGIFAIGNAADAEGYQYKQLIGFGLSLAVLVFFSLVSYKFVFKFYWIIYASMIVLLLLVMLFGETNLGAKRWIDLGFTQFQPSEVAKIFLIIFMATYLYKRQERMNTFKTLVPLVILSLIPIGFIYKQPDLSTTIVIFLTFCAIMFLSGIHYKIITGVLVIAIPIVLVVGYIAIQPESGILEEYQYNRLIGFYQKDNESAKDDKWQQENSVLAIGSGGLTGKSLNDSSDIISVKEGNFLPESHTDFIFAIVGEELGFVGAAAVIILLFAIVIECFITGSRAPNLHGRIFCYGFGVLLGLQSFVNIGVTTMILPNTGLTLPFVSYGLTSLISMYCGIGIVLNIGLQRKNALV